MDGTQQCHTANAQQKGLPVIVISYVTIRASWLLILIFYTIPLSQKVAHVPSRGGPLLEIWRNLALVVEWGSEHRELGAGRHVLPNQPPPFGTVILNKSRAYMPAYIPWKQYLDPGLIRVVQPFWVYLFHLPCCEEISGRLSGQLPATRREPK